MKNCYTLDDEIQGYTWQKEYWNTEEIHNNKSSFLAILDAISQQSVHRKIPTTLPPTENVYPPTLRPCKPKMLRKKGKNKIWSRIFVAAYKRKIDLNDKASWL